jgi:Fur family ferric uptake transcriptional regulator
VKVQSVYNALGDFVATGLVRRIEPAGHAGLYELRVHDNHHHLVCSGCGRIEDVDCVVGQAPCLAPSATHGFAVHTAEVTFWGLCPDCRSRGS